MNLCERFHCLPSQLYAEDSELGRMLIADGMYRQLTEPTDTDTA